MRQVLWAAVLVTWPILSYGQDPKPQAPPKQNGAPPAVMSPKAAIPPAGADRASQSPETDPAKMAAVLGATKPDSLAPVGKTYVIGPEDVLQIVIWGDRTLSGTYTVRPDGRFGIPLAGEFLATGRTPEELAGDVEERLKSTDILRNPNVTVGVQEVKSKVIYVIGEVNRPGKFPLVVDTTVLVALVNAGGFKDFANQKNIIIQRGTQRFKFNYKDVLKGKKIEQNILLQPGDYVIVK